MGRKPGFKHSEETRGKISKGVKRSHLNQPAEWFVFEVATSKGIFYGIVGAELEEQAKSLIKGILGKALNASISKIVPRKRVPSGDNTFTITSKGEFLAGRGLWVAAGREVPD